MSNQYYLVIFVVLFALIFYFMVMRPQQKRYKAQQELMSSIKKGDKVMLTAGIYGTVKKVDDKVVEVEIARDTTIKVVRAAIRDVIRDKETAKAIDSTTRTRASGSAKTEAADEIGASDGTESDETGKAN